MKYIGLDISSTTIGLSLINLDENNKVSLLKYDYYKPIKDDLFLSLHKTREYIINKIKEWEPDEAVIENNLMFIGNKSSANTIILLAIYNKTCGLACYETLGKDPHLFNMQTARSLIKLKGYEGKLQKEDIPATVEKILGIPFPYVFKKNGKIADETFDIADSVAITLGYISSEILKSQPKVSKRKYLTKVEK